VREGEKVFRTARWRRAKVPSNSRSRDRGRETAFDLPEKSRECGNRTKFVPGPAVWLLLISKTFIVSKTAGKIKTLKKSASPTTYHHFHLHHQGCGSEIYIHHTDINVMKIFWDRNAFSPANIVMPRVEFA
jgi:hypothetical protein